LTFRFGFREGKPAAGAIGRHHDGVGENDAAGESVGGQDQIVRPGEGERRKKGEGEREQPGGFHKATIATAKVRTKAKRTNAAGIDGGRTQGV